MKMTRISRIGICLSSCLVSPVQSFIPTTPVESSHRRDSHHRRISTKIFSNDDDDDDEGKDPRSLDEFLDQPFFDPDSFNDDDTSLLGRLAAFVKRDYELAETIYVGLIFVMLVIASQEFLRMQIYGDHYMPFQSLGAGAARHGKMF
jgi:hypothetical protein